MARLTLAELQPGDRANVVQVEGSSAHRLAEMGLLKGTELQFIRSAPMGDPIEVRVRGYHLSLRRTEAAGVLVERCD